MTYDVKSDSLSGSLLINRSCIVLRIMTDFDIMFLLEFAIRFKIDWRTVSSRYGTSNEKSVKNEKTRSEQFLSITISLSKSVHFFVQFFSKSDKHDRNRKAAALLANMNRCSENIWMSIWSIPEGCWSNRLNLTCVMLNAEINEFSFNSPSFELIKKFNNDLSEVMQLSSNIERGMS